MSIECNINTEWKLDCLKSLLDGFDSMVSKTVVVRDVKLAHDLTNITLFSAGKSIVIFREIITLCTNGYPDGALALARNLYEQFIILYFFFANRNNCALQGYLDDYYANYEIQRLNILKEYYKATKNDSEELVIQGELDKIKSFIQKKTRGDYWWADANSFKELKDKVLLLIPDDGTRNIIDHMHLAYKRSSVTLHANCLGNINRLCNADDFWGVDTSQRFRGFSISLWLAALSFQYVTKAVCYELHIEDKYSDELYTLSLFYAQKMKDEFYPNKN